MCAIDCGNKFGHIYIIEKIYIEGKPRYRIYQSCHRSYLLIDYIELMDYASDFNKGIDINQHFIDLTKLITAEQWRPQEIKLFCKWFHFYPSARVLSSDKKQFASTYLIF